LSATSIRDFLVPTIQNLLKDLDALDPAHKEALEIILKERSGGAFESISKVMGAHLGLASSVSSFFGESGLLGKKEVGDLHEPAAPPQQPSPPALQDDTRFRRMMRGGFSEMLRGKVNKGHEEPPSRQSGTRQRVIAATCGSACRGMQNSGRRSQKRGSPLAMTEGWIRAAVEAIHSTPTKAVVYLSGGASQVLHPPSSSSSPSLYISFFLC
ncbi:hypothetical protein BHE74_00052533, partial [Ensete ventricosum]